MFRRRKSTRFRQQDFLHYFKKNRPDIGDRIKGGEGLPDDLKKEILSVAQEYMSKQFQ